MTLGQRPFLIDAVVFDKDGVLADSEGINVSATRRAFADFGISLPKFFERRIVGQHPDDFLQPLCDSLSLPSSAVEQISRNRARIYAELWAQEGQLFPGVVSLLNLLCRAEVPVGLCSNATRTEVDGFIAQFGLQDRIRLALSRDDVARPKPQPDIYCLAAKRLGIAPDRMLVVEDSPAGIAAAAASGALCAAVSARGLEPETARLVGAELRSILDLASCFELALAG